MSDSTNRGGGPAIALTADIKPVKGQSGFQAADLAKSPLDLQPGDRVTVRAALAMGSALDYAVLVSWADPDGRPHEQMHRIEFRPL